ncbi:MAG: stage II sporulation protein M [Eubacteriales bacterium]|nr:stage II sporulation protein M [Eubacteriales bacterium]
MDEQREAVGEVKRKTPFLFFYILGTVAGILLPCFLWKYEIALMKSTSIYFLASLETRTAAGWTYFREIAGIRGVYWLLWVLSGFSIFGIPLSVVTVVWKGFMAGGIVTMSILHFGILGGVWGCLLLLPQYFIYVPVSILLSEQIIKVSGFSWKNRRMTGRELRNYGISAFLLSIGMTLGMFLEAFINPLLLGLFVQRWKLF